MSRWESFWYSHAGARMLDKHFLYWSSTVYVRSCTQLWFLAATSLSQPTRVEVAVTSFALEINIKPDVCGWSR